MMQEITVNLSEYEASTLYEATNGTLHWMQDQIERSQKERLDILKRVLGARLGLRVTLIGNVKSKPFVMEFEDSKLNTVRDISKTMKFHCRRSEVLSKINQKIDSTNEYAVTITSYENLEESLLYKLHTFFTTYYPATTLKSLQELFSKLKLH